jgi:transposase
MALGRQRGRQLELLATWAEMPRSPSQVFYDHLQAELVSAGFDSSVEGQCAPYHAARRGRPSLPPGVTFACCWAGTCLYGAFLCQRLSGGVDSSA